MPVITKITLQKHNKERYSIFTDSGKEEEYAFSVDEDILIKYNFKKGMELDELAVTEVLFQDDIRKAYNLAIQYLSRRMRSEGEVRESLRKKEVSDPIIQEVIDRLYKYQFLNDDEFAKAFVRTQMNTTDKGPVIVRTELKDKGVNETIIDLAMAEYPTEQQIEKAVKLGNKFIGKNVRDSSRILKQKLEQLLVRKGYPFSVINLAADEIIIEKLNDAEMEALKYQGEKFRKKHAKLSGTEFTLKLKQGLYKKGFPMDLIERYLSELEVE